MTDKNDTKYTAFVFHVLKMILQGGKDTEICITPFFDFINQRFPTQKNLISTETNRKGGDIVNLKVNSLNEQIGVNYT